MESRVANKRILCLLSEFGYWGEELVGPLFELDKAGYTTDFVTPTGQKPRPLPPSMDPSYVDPPLGRPVTDELNARRTREIDESSRLDYPISLKEWFPERPYRSMPDFLRQQEAYYDRLDKLVEEIDRSYDALLMVGGSGPTVDLANNQRVHDLILVFYRLGKPIAAECYSVTQLAFARDPGGDRKSIISGKRVTGHCIEYDYKDGHGVLGIDFNFGPPPYPLEYILRDATQPGGAYIGNFGKAVSCIVDYPFVTGRSTSDSYKTGEKLVEVLEHGLRRWGW
jgi:putative intracellular protease/amidase